MAVVIGVVCVAAGFHNASNARAQWRLVWTQTLHWGAFLVAMNLVLLPVVRSIANADIVSLAILLLLALGTFIAGVHIASWRMCANGVIMAIGIPVIAWLGPVGLICNPRHHRARRNRDRILLAAPPRNARGNDGSRWSLIIPRRRLSEGRRTVLPSLASEIGHGDTSKSWSAG